MNIAFERPEFIYALLPTVLVLAAVSAFALRRRKKLLSAFGERIGEVSSVPRTKVQILRIAVGILAFIAFELALAGPSEQGLVKRNVLKAVIAVDISSSMGATDVEPSRFALAARELQLLFAAVPYEEVSLVAFGEQPLWLIRHTSETEEVLWSLTHDIAIGDLPEPGSNINNVVLAAVKHAAKRFGKGSVVVLLSDGGDSTSGEIVEALSAARSAGVRVVAIGVGTLSGASVELEEGETVETRLAESGMETLSNGTGGVYRRAITGHELADAISTHPEFLVKAIAKGSENHYQIPLIVGVILLFLWFSFPIR